MKPFKGAIQLSVNDHEVPMNSFVASLVANVIIGLLNSLTITEEPKQIAITMDLNPKE